MKLDLFSIPIYVGNIDLDKIKLLDYNFFDMLRKKSIIRNTPTTTNRRSAKRQRQRGGSFGTIDINTPDDIIKAFYNIYNTFNTPENIEFVKYIFTEEILNNIPHSQRTTEPNSVSKAMATEEHENKMNI